MVNEWVTISVIAFGIVVAIVGVAAYIRMYKKSSWTASRPQQQTDRTGEDDDSGKDDSAE